MENILFSVITVCYNCEGTIRRTIESVLAQTYPYIEYLIIDGASADATAAIAGEYRAAFEAKGICYKIQSEQEKGIYYAMNKGIWLASGEVAGFLNAGDWYEKNAVAVAAEKYRKTHYDYFYAALNLVRMDRGIIVKYPKRDLFPTSRHWNHPTSFARKELYKELGAFKCEGIHDDFEFFLRVRKAGKKIVITNKVIANFVTGGASNQKSAKLFRKRIADRYRGYRETGYSPFYFLECVGMEVMKYMLS